ncbi:hypothetical protein JW930_04155 [Candidatus Woesearchaeota archaeon]|nr:hypothetical protein [Candidatus Woesearchaeota archaeon]
MDNATVHLKQFGAGIQKSIVVSFSLIANMNIIKLRFEAPDLILETIFTDTIDVEEMEQLLEKEKKKAIFLCYLKINEKEYRGKRKLLWRGDNLALSIGGIRLETGPEDAVKLLNAIRLIRIKH